MAKRTANQVRIDRREQWYIDLPNSMVFVENSNTARIVVKRRILNQELIPYTCAICNIGPFWNGKPMPLILDHINGVNNDNRIENLRFVCSNCDSQLDTYKSKNRKKHLEDEPARVLDSP